MAKKQGKKRAAKKGALKTGAAKKAKAAALEPVAAMLNATGPRKSPRPAAALLER